MVLAQPQIGGESLEQSVLFLGEAERHGHVLSYGRASFVFTEMTTRSIQPPSTSIRLSAALWARRAARMSRGSSVMAENGVRSARLVRGRSTAKNQVRQNVESTS